MCNAWTSTEQDRSGKRYAFLRQVHFINSVCLLQKFATCVCVSVIYLCVISFFICFFMSFFHPSSRFLSPSSFFPSIFSSVYERPTKSFRYRITSINNEHKQTSVKFKFVHSSEASILCKRNQLLDTEGLTLHIFVYDTRLYAIQWLVSSKTKNFLAAKIHHTFHVHYES